MELKFHLDATSLANPTTPSIVGCYIARPFACSPYCMLLQVVACCWELLFENRQTCSYANNVGSSCVRFHVALRWCYTGRFASTILAQQSVAMLQQCCNYSKQCRNSVATLCCAKNRRCESSRVISPLYRSRYAPKERWHPIWRVDINPGLPHMPQPRISCRFNSRTSWTPSSYQPWSWKKLTRNFITGSKMSETRDFCFLIGASEFHEINQETVDQ